MNDKDDSAQQDYNGQQHRYPSTSYDLHRNQYHEHSVYENTYHHESPYHYQRRNSNNTDMPHHYLQRGHRHSTDSAAADTLLMLSAAAFMDPDAIRLVTSTTPNGAAADEAATASTVDDGQDRLCPCIVVAPYRLAPALETSSSSSQGYD
ncbi:hypothetical protein EC991_000249 [Linnemannia zychae]|nr:hypothetical protein EC991_000249 [Linnemannia zychae]